jgi:hypothetical protein
VRYWGRTSWIGDQPHVPAPIAKPGAGCAAAGTSNQVAGGAARVRAATPLGNRHAGRTAATGCQRRVGDGPIHDVVTLSGVERGARRGSTQID